MCVSACVRDEKGEAMYSCCAVHVTECSVCACTCMFHSYTGVFTLVWQTHVFHVPEITLTCLAEITCHVRHAQADMPSHSSDTTVK